MSRPSRPSLVFARKEIREILRDRRAMLLSFVLPIFVYPLTFSLTSWLERREESRAGATVYRVAVTGDAAVLHERLRAEKVFVVVRPTEGTDLAEEVRAGRLEAWVDASEGLEPHDGEAPTVRIVHHGPHSASAEAEERIQEVLDGLRDDEANHRYRRAGGGSGLDDIVHVEAVDVATGAETGGARAGRMIPLLLVMTLFIGGSALSTDLFAGEKERGTLETLYLTPVHRSRIARAKFLVVWGGTTITGMLNLASLLFCFRQGLISDPEKTTAAVALVGDGVATAFLLVVPLAALVGGVLLGISAFARSLKEAQYYVTPVMLVAILPGLLAMGQEVALNAFTALIPIANVALTVRDGLLGPVPALLLALVAIASMGWGYLAMQWTVRILAREDTILGFDPEPFLARTTSGRRRAALLGMSISVLVYFYVGNLLQSRSLIPGLLVSLWVLLPALVAGTAVLAWNGGSVPELISLRRPPGRALLAAALIGAGLVVPMIEGLMKVQGQFLPSPEGLFEPLTDPLEKLSLPALLFTLAVSPGVMEELAFRGVFFGLLRRCGSTRSAVVVSAAFFALIHLSIFRFAPTFLIGVLIAIVVLRSGSIFPAMLFHAVYNGVATAASRAGKEEAMGGALPWGLSLAALAAGAFFLATTRSTATRSASTQSASTPSATAQSPSTRRPNPPT